MKQQRTNSKLPVFRVGAFLLVIVLLLGSLSLAAAADDATVYTVKMENKTVVADGTPQMIFVTDTATGKTVDINTKITYQVDGLPYTSSITKRGVYKITAFLPEGYTFKNTAGSTITTLEATLTVLSDLFKVDVEGDDGFVIFLQSTSDNAIGNTVNVSKAETFAMDKKGMPAGTKYAQTLRIALDSIPEGETFSLIIPLTDAVCRAGCKKISASSLYVIKDGEAVLATEAGFTVEYNSGDGYIKVANIAPTTAVFAQNFLIAPQYSGSLPIGWIIAILLIIFLVLLIVFFCVGCWLYKKKQEEEPEEPKKEEAPVEEAPVEEPVEETPVEEAPAEEPVEEVPVEEEAAPVEEAPAEEPVVEAFVALETPTVNEAAIAPTQPAMRGLLYIDVVKKPEEYGMMLVKEKAGEGTVVYRYRKSYLAKLALADGKIGDYYSIVKNALLRFRGVKARKSWNYEAFNKGRNQIARIIPNGKTLYLYLAIDPKTLEGTKYGAIDVSDKKKFADTPSLMKVRGDRKLKFALELIEKICGEMLELKPIADRVDEDYKPTFQTAEKLFDAGLIRKMAALAPIVPEE